MAFWYNFAPFPRWDNPIASIVPFTHRDGLTYIESLEKLREHLNKLIKSVNDFGDAIDKEVNDRLNLALEEVADKLQEQVTEVNRLIAEADEAFDGKIAEFDRQVTDQLDQQNEFVNSSIASLRLEVNTTVETLRAYVDAEVAKIIGQSIELGDDVLMGILMNPQSDTARWLADRWLTKKVKIVLGIGQSNMSGRGRVYDPNFDETVDGILQWGFKSQTMSAAREPLDMIDTPPGIGPLFQFGRHLKDSLDPDDVVILVPAAIGATSLTSGSTNSWRYGVSGGLTSRALASLRAAVQRADALYPNAEVEIEAVLWHQGEADANIPVSGSDYETQLRRLITGIRTELSNPDLPFIVGAMVRTNETARQRINGAHSRVGRFMHNVRYVDSNPNQIGDNNHYNAEGQRILGLGYYVAYRQIIVGLAPTSPLYGANGDAIAYDEFDRTAGPALASPSGPVWESYVNSSTVEPPRLMIVNPRRVSVENTSSISWHVIDVANTERLEFNPSIGSLNSDRTSWRWVFKFMDPNNYMFVDVFASGGTNYRIASVVNGEVVSVASPVTFLTTHDVRITVGSTSVRAFANGTELFDAPFDIPAKLQGATKYGYRIDPNMSAMLGPIYVRAAALTIPANA